jgi:hypothetical protein
VEMHSRGPDTTSAGHSTYCPWFGRPFVDPVHERQNERSRRAQRPSYEISGESMSFLIWVSHHRLWAGAIGFTVIVAAAIVAVWFVVFRSPGTQINQIQALDIYHRAQKTQPSANALLPEPGIYRYRSSGRAVSAGRSPPSAT